MQGIKRLSRRRVLLFLLVTPLLLLLQFCIGLFIFFNLQTINKKEIQQTRLDTYLRTNTKYISNAESAERGYLLTGNKKYYDTYKVDMDELKKNEDYFNTLPAELKTDEISNIQSVSKSKLEEMGLTIKLFRNHEKDSALAVENNENGKILMDTLRKRTTTIRDHISGELNSRKNEERYLFILFLTLIAVLICFNLFLVWYTYKVFKQYTENMEHLIDSLEGANERMKRFNDMSYHELKTPLRGIGGFAQLLKKKFAHHLDNEESEYLDYITDNVKLMDKTINDMRDKYLAEAGSDEIQSD